MLRIALAPRRLFPEPLSGLRVILTAALVGPSGCLHSAPAAATILLMSLTTSRRQSTLPVFAALLLAAMLFFQGGAGFASPLSSNGIAVAPVSEAGCCGIGSEQGCGDVSALEAADACARHCAQSGSFMPTQIALSASYVPVCAAGDYTEKAVFPAHRPILTAAPRAISSTPLIYHLQRLLN